MSFLASISSKSSVETLNDEFGTTEEEANSLGHPLKLPTKNLEAVRQGSKGFLNRLSSRCTKDQLSI